MPDLTLEELLEAGKKLKNSKSKTKKVKEEKLNLYEFERLSPKPRIPISKELKEYLISERGIICEICEYNIMEHIHHIDEDPTNNDLDNLQLLCIDCHRKQHV